MKLTVDEQCQLGVLLADILHEWKGQAANVTALAAQTQLEPEHILIQAQVIAVVQLLDRFAKQRRRQTCQIKQADFISRPSCN